MTIATSNLPELVATADNPFDLPNVPSDSLFAERNADFLPSSELTAIGDALCAARKQLQVSEHISIEYLYKRKGGVTGGKAVLGKCIKTSGLVRFFANLTTGADYVIWIAADAVRAYRMANWQLEALLFHEILHIAVEVDKNDNEKLTTRGHSWEGFNEEIDAYGLWWTDLSMMGVHVRQLKLSGLELATDNMRQMTNRLASEGVTLTMSVRP